MKRTGIEIQRVIPGNVNEKNYRGKKTSARGQKHKNHDARKSRKMYILNRQRRITGVDKLNWQDSEQQNMLTEKYDSTEVSG